MRISFATALCAVLLLASAAVARGEIITNSSEDLRTGWYPGETAITPELLNGGTFGPEWSTAVQGQVYAQPLLDGSTLLVATEHNEVYGLDPATGAVKWAKTLTHPKAWNPADIGCADLTPEIGVTSTPVIDTATNTAYLTHKTYASGSSGPARWWMDAIDMSTGEEQPNFPVQIGGEAENHPGTEFDATDQLQRPGLLLMEGVVYAGFGSDCDHPPWEGWVFGVSTTGKVTARWATDAEGEGAGIWQAGSGLASDGPRTLLLSTGNGFIPEGPIPGSEPPGGLGQSIVRLSVGSKGELKPTDFFAPYDAEALNEWDADFGSGGVTGLPGEYFGTASIPHLAVAVGKDGYVYLLNRDDLGGFGEGPGGEDASVGRAGPYGGVWSRPGVWPGEGGWVYIPTASGGNSATGSSGTLDVYEYGHSSKGVPQLTRVASSGEPFGFSSSAPIITSAGTNPGSGLVWIVWAPNGSGAGAQLRAYATRPVEGEPRKLWSAPIGTSSKFAMPGVGLGRIYVGTRDGHVLGFGSPVTPALTGSPTEFPPTTIESSTEASVTLRATEPVTITEATTTSPQFKVTGLSQPLPAKLAGGQTIEVHVEFAPTETGPLAASLTIGTETGKSLPFSLSGTGRASGAKLTVEPRVLSLGGTTVGQSISGAVTLHNVGASPLTIEHVQPPAAPFSIEPGEEPQPGQKIEPGGHLAVPVEFRPSADGSFEGHLAVESSGGTETVAITGSASPPGELHISPESLEYGPVAAGGEETQSFTIDNAGGLPVQINISKPPIANAFHADTKLEEGESVIAPHASVVESVTFAPTSLGRFEDVWRIVGEDTTGTHEVLFGGEGVNPPAPATSSGPGPGGLISPPPGLGELGVPPAPIATLAARSLTATRRGTVVLHVRCPAGETWCKGAVTLRTLTPIRLPGQHRAKVATLAAGSFDVSGGHVAAITVRLGPLGRALLARRHLLHLRVVLAAADAAGLRHTGAVTITLRAPR